MTSFRNLVDSFAKSPSNNVMYELIEAVHTLGPTDDDIAHLALRLAESGETLNHSGVAQVADIPSTGGPSSLSTIICPLYLRAMAILCRNSVCLDDQRGD